MKIIKVIALGVILWFAGTFILGFVISVLFGPSQNEALNTIMNVVLFPIALWVSYIWFSKGHE